MLVTTVDFYLIHAPAFDYLSLSLLRIAGKPVSAASLVAEIEPHLPATNKLGFARALFWTSGGRGQGPYTGRLERISLEILKK